MDVLSGVASVSQLLAYSSTCIRSLLRVYVDLKSGDHSYREEQSNITLLLDIIRRISSQDLDTCDPVLPVLISVSSIASEISQLLQPRTVLGLNWASLVNQSKLRAAFEALEKKRGILHLHISQSNKEALDRVRSAIQLQELSNPHFQTMEKIQIRKKKGERKNQTSSPTGRVWSMSGNQVDGVMTCGNSKHLKDVHYVTMDNNKVASHAVLHGMNDAPLPDKTVQSIYGRNNESLIEQLHAEIQAMKSQSHNGGVTRSFAAPFFVNTVMPKPVSTAPDSAAFNDISRPGYQSMLTHREVGKESHDSTYVGAVDEKETRRKKKH